MIEGPHFWVMLQAGYRGHIEVNPPEIRVKGHYSDYTTAFMTSYEADSSYAYHHFNEMVEHWAFKKGRVLQADEIQALKERIVLQGGHLWMKDTAQVMILWWKRDG
ncbi:MAG: hypothetical protein ACPL6D_16805 [Thermodesulfobacteriota bacterium]